MSKVDSIRQEQARLAIGGASRAAGVDFGYLMAQALIESGLDPNAQARTSSAAGLFQFTNSTWLSMLDRHGDAYGLGWASHAIERAQGRHDVQDPLMRKQILALRYDPSLAAAMAAEFAKENCAVLAPILGREPDHAELYLAHFLGAGGAGKFLRALQSAPDRAAAVLFPEAASANRSIFYAKDGSARTVTAVMALVRSKVERAKQQIERNELSQQGADVPSIDAAHSLAKDTLSRNGIKYSGSIAQEFERYPVEYVNNIRDAYTPRSISTTILDSFGSYNKSIDAKSGMIHNAYAKFKGLGF